MELGAVRLRVRVRGREVGKEGGVEMEMHLLPASWWKGGGGGMSYAAVFTLPHPVAPILSPFRHSSRCCFAVASSLHFVPAQLSSVPVLSYPILLSAQSVKRGRRRESSPDTTRQATAVHPRSAPPTPHHRYYQKYRRKCAPLQRLFTQYRR